MEIKLSAIDEQRFGMVTAKANMSRADQVSDVMHWCMKNSVDMLIARCPTDQYALVQSMESEGFHLMDTLVYFATKLGATSLASLPAGFSWRLANQDDAKTVEGVAKVAFKDYLGHYHADPRLKNQDCDLVYSSWAANSCSSPIVADAVLVILDQETIVAFLTLKLIENANCEIVLNAVLPEYQGNGLYGILIELAKTWSHANDCVSLFVSTQVTNTAPQKVWCRHGFEPSNSFYTFHKWFK